MCVLVPHIVQESFVWEFSCAAQGENSLLTESLPAKNIARSVLPHIFQTSQGTNEWV